MVETISARPSALAGSRSPIAPVGSRVPPSPRLRRINPRDRFATNTGGSGKAASYVCVPVGGKGLAEIANQWKDDAE